MSRDMFDILRDKQNAANAAKRAKARQPFVSGFCQNVQRDLHDPCKTGYISAKDQTWVQCACDCHAVASHEAESAGVLLELPDLIQGSDEWHDQRRGMVTASAVGQLITASTLKPASNDYSRGLTALLVAERITGYTEPTYINDDMLRGIEDEPRAIEKYGEHYAPVVTTGFMVRDYGTHQLGYSPDGLVGADGLVEVKSRRQKKHLQTILSGQVPAENMAQLQCGLLVRAASGATTSPTAAACRWGRARASRSAMVRRHHRRRRAVRDDRRRDGRGLSQGNQWARS